MLIFSMVFCVKTLMEGIFPEGKTGEKNTRKTGCSMRCFLKKNMTGRGICIRS